MKINIVGAGPAGLYFAILMKKLDPSMSELPKTLLGHLGTDKLEQLADLLDAILSGTKN